MIIKESYGIQFGCETLSPSTVKGFTSTLIKPTSGSYTGIDAKMAVIKALSNPINFRLDGVDPTTSTGMQLAAGDYWVIEGFENIQNFRCLDTAEGASSVRCMFFF